MFPGKKSMETFGVYVSWKHGGNIWKHDMEQPAKINKHIAEWRWKHFRLSPKCFHTPL